MRFVLGPPNDCRINCKAASHSDGDRGAVLAYLEADLRELRRRSSVDCSRRAIARRANKRRFVNFLQLLGGALKDGLCCVSAAALSERADAAAISGVR